MAKGNYLVRGDKTTCGGVITEGCEDHCLFGQAIAREGDKVTCGQHPGMYNIVGGIANDSVHGRKMAGTLDSKSSCPCQARFIASILDDTYEKVSASASSTMVQSNATKKKGGLPLFSETASSVPASWKGETCNFSENPLYDGVFLWTEKEGAGHVFVSIHVRGAVYLFTYGRYDQQGFSPTGEGVLIKYSGTQAKDYYTKELYRMSAHVFLITDVDSKKALEIFDALWDSSNVKPDGENTSTEIKAHGHVIDRYDLTGNNCATISTNGLKKAGTKIFDVKLYGDLGYSEDFTIPSSLDLYLSRMASGVNMLVINLTATFKDYIENNENYQVIDGAGLGNESSGVVGRGSGIQGEASSGYSMATIGGILGSVDD